MMEAASTSETSVDFYQTTRLNNPEDSHIPSIYDLKMLFVYFAKVFVFLCPCRTKEKYLILTQLITTV
jgi:hypothetical protein